MIEKAPENFLLKTGWRHGCESGSSFSSIVIITAALYGCALHDEVYFWLPRVLKHGKKNMVSEIPPGKITLEHTSQFISQSLPEQK